MPSQHPASTRNRFAALLFFGLVSLYLIGLLIGPRVPDSEQTEYCVSNYHFVWVFGHSLNCDSSEFLVNAKDPATLLAPGSMRQERPGSSLLVYAISWPLDLVYRSIRKESGFEIERNIDPSGRIAHDRVERITDKAQYVPYYAGFIILNSVVLIGCLALYAYSIGLGALRWALFSLPSFWLGLLVIANNVTKQFFWSPHTQLLNILAALGGIAACIALFEAAQRQKVYWATSFAFGVMMLFYGAFIVPVIATGLIYLYLEFRDNGIGSRSLGRLLLVNLVAVALFIVPYLSWHAYVVWLNGDFSYTYEKFDHIIWVAKIYSAEGISAVVRQFGAYWLAFFKFAILQGWGLFFLFAVIWGLALRAKPRESDRLDERTKLVIAVGLVFVLLLSLFVSLYGLPRYRLAFSALVPVIIILGLMMRRIELAPVRPAALLAITGGGLALYAIWNVVKFGPYS